MPHINQHDNYRVKITSSSTNSQHSSGHSSSHHHHSLPPSSVGPLSSCGVYWRPQPACCSTSSSHHRGHRQPHLLADDYDLADVNEQFLPPKQQHRYHRQHPPALLQGVSADPDSEFPLGDPYSSDRSVVTASSSTSSYDSGSTTASSSPPQQRQKQRQQKQVKAVERPTQQVNASTAKLLLPSLSSVSSSSSSMMMSSSSMRNDALIKRVAEYEARGWITRTDFHRYRELMQKKGKSDYYRQQIAKDLDAIASRQEHIKSRGSAASSSSSSSSSLQSQSPDKSNTDSDTPSDSGPPSVLRKSGSGRNNRVSWEDQSQTSVQSGSEFAAILEDNKENGKPKRSSSRSSSSTEQQPHDRHHHHPPATTTTTTTTTLSNKNATILEPIDLWQGPGRLTEQQLQELFVEMCFYARLGFLQPPCCLKCTYRDSMHKQPNQQTQGHPKCRRWVVWRKDAQRLLHPEGLDGNIIILQCHVVRTLLAGDVVEGRQWDPNTKMIFTVK